MAITKKPSLILIPGAWHPTKLYRPLFDQLEKMGYEVYPVDYPSTAMAPKTETLDDDLAAVHAKLVPLVDRGDDVMIIAHSAGGAIATQCGEGFSKTDRQKQGKPGGIVRMFYMTAFAPPEGTTFTNGDPAVGSDFSDVYPDEGVRRVKKETLHHVFYNKCSKEAGDYAISQLLEFSTAVEKHRITYAGWKHIPSTYLICENDNAIPLDVQQSFISQPGANFMVLKCSADHSPFICMPDVAAAAIDKAANTKDTA